MKSPTGTNEPDTFVERARKVLIDYEGPDRVVSSIEYAELYRARAKPKVSLCSGLPTLDEAVSSFETGELIVLSGPTGMGKTLLCDTIIRNFRKDSHFSLFLTFEVTPQTIALKHDTPETVVFLPLEHRGRDLEWIFFRVLEAKTKYNCEAVFIDHLHYLIDMGSQQNISLEIGKVMRAIKRMALEADVCIFIVCHVKQLDMEQEPSIYHLRDSSFVGQEADTVLMVWRRWDLSDDGRKLDTRLQGLATLKVEKARRSGIMGQKINIKKDGHVLVESKDEPELKRRVKQTQKDDWFPT